LSTASETVSVNTIPEGSITIGAGDSATNDFLPSFSYYNYALTQQIYTAEELGEAGTINGMAFYNDGGERTRTYDFYLKATTKSSFTSRTDWVTVTDADKVFSGTVTMTADAWTFVVFDTPFEYDGTSNLVLVADDNSGSYTSTPYMSCRVFAASNQTLYYFDDNINFDPLSPPTSASSNIYGNVYTNDVLSEKNQIIIVKEVNTTVAQTSTFNTGWTWWTPNIDMDGATLLSQLEQALGDNGVKITAQDGKAVSYVANNGWGGRLNALEVGKMYQIKVSANCNVTLEGPAVDLTNHSITLANGINWIGFFGTESMSVATALSNLQATEGDKISSQNGTYATYMSGSWGGRLQTLEPGKAYIYNSKDTISKTFYFPSAK
jgi:hypothetical protein